MSAATPKGRPWRSIAFRLALYYGVLLLLTMVVVLAIFYVQMVGVLSARIDQQAKQDLKRLEAHARHYGEASLQQEIRNLLSDGVDSQTEIVILTDAQGHMLVGNASIQPQRSLSTLGLRELQVQRDGRTLNGRVAVARLESSHMLIVGSDMEALRDIEQRFMRASLSAVVIVVILALSGSAGFRRLVDERAASIRRTLQQVAAGDMGQRIPLPNQDDEFTRLGRDINKMLDQVEHLMDGVRHVSNTIAHNLRTPLTRVLLQLRSASHLSGIEQQRLLERAEQEVQDLGTVFEKLLQIAELETGMRRQEFTAVDLEALLAEIEDLYAPVAEDAEGTLQVQLQGQPRVLADADLLASALANLVENALKYACQQAGGRITITAQVDGHTGLVDLRVQDNGPGVPPERMSQLTQRFFRAHERLPGHGLGLSSVQAIVSLHDGLLDFANLHPGFEVRLQLPAAA
ncbi:MAG: HAMP domain-containing histidine kinase [Acidovorax sp.]|jgi:signal transduction histidine kinase|nr:HAMP domain-containing histidine kinase [Acidovorax sp.]